MVCRIADADVVTEDLNWQSIGAPFASPADPRAGASHPASAPPETTRRQTAAETDPDGGAVQRRIAAVEAQRDHDMEQARQAGIEQGLRQARQEAAAEMQGALDRLARSIQEVAQVKRRVRSEAENELVKLSLAIARRILHREVTADPQSLRGVVYAALQRLQSREITRIRVFPPAVPAVKAALERNGGMAAIEIVADGMLQPGGLLFETSLGELDASVETQLQEIERGFADRLQLR